MNYKKILKIGFIPLLLIIGFVIYKGVDWEYTVTFDVDDGSKLIAETVKKNQLLTEPETPTRAGYKFKGWYVDDEEWDFNNKIKKNFTLVAKWEKLSEEEQEELDEVVYTVKFDSNGGSSVSEQEVIENGLGEEPTKPTRSGYTFKGWYVDDEKWDFTTPVTANLELTAKWGLVGTSKPLTLTIKFNSNGGSKIANQVIKKGSVIKRPVVPTRTGYKFLGWYSGNDAWNFNWRTNINLTLTAKWKKVVAEEVPVVDKYTLKTKIVDDFSPDLHIFIYKNGEDITKQVEKLMAEDYILAMYSSGIKALRTTKVEYEKYKQDQLEVIIDGKSYEVIK